MLFMFLFNKIINIDNQDFIPVFRIFFGITRILLCCFWCRLYFKISKRKDLNVYIDSENKNIGNKRTFMEHDLTEIISVLWKMLVQMAFISFVHFKWRTILPLVMASTTSILNVIDNKV